MTNYSIHTRHAFIFVYLLSKCSNIKRKNVFVTFRYEKMISGMYMGEIVRLALEKLRKNGLLFNGKGSEELSTRGRFYTKYVSEIERSVSRHFVKENYVWIKLTYLLNFMNLLIGNIWKIWLIFWSTLFYSWTVMLMITSRIPNKCLTS